MTLKSLRNCQLIKGKLNTAFLHFCQSIFVMIFQNSAACSMLKNFRKEMTKVLFIFNKLSTQKPKIQSLKALCLVFYFKSKNHQVFSIFTMEYKYQKGVSVERRKHFKRHIVSRFLSQILF